MGYLVRKYKFEWDNINGATNQAPTRSYRLEPKGWEILTTDSAINVLDAESIAVQTDPDNLSASHASTDWDMNVIATVNENDAVYDDGADGIYAESNGDVSGIRTFLVSPGPDLIKLRLDENSSNAAHVRAYVTVRKYQ